MDSDDLRDKLLNDNPIEHRKAARSSNSSGASRIPLLLAIVALVIGLGVIYYLVQLNQRYQMREASLNTQLAELHDILTSVGERLDQDQEQLGEMGTDLELVQKRVGITQSEIQKARALAEQLREEQEQKVAALNQQIATKADSESLENLDQRSDTKFQEIDGQISEVQQDVQASRQEIEKTWQELNSLGLKLSEHGQLIATNQDGLDELRRRGERDYLEFDARKNARLSVANISMELRRTEHKKHRANLRLYYDDRTVERKQIYTNTPVIFYVGRERIQYELVINSVERDQISGYISVPKGKVSTTPRLGETTSR